MTGAAPAAVSGASAQGALPIVPASAEPASVRDGSPALKRAWREGLAFEEMLLEELAQSLSATAGLGGEGEAGEAGEAAAAGEATGQGSPGGPLAGALLPRTLAEGMLRGGGVGLAAQLAETLARPGSLTGAGSAGGASGREAGPLGAAGAVGGAQAPSETSEAGPRASDAPGQRGGARAPSSGGAA